MGHGGQGSGSSSAVATWSLDHDDPTHYSLQTICIFTFLHSTTCRSWKNGYFQLFDVLHHFIKITGILNELVFECCVACVGRKREGQDTKHLLCTNASAAVLRDLWQLPICEHYLTDPEFSSQQNTKQHHILIITVFSLQLKKKKKILHLILKLPLAKINWP